ncbi:MAG: Rieske 2Fe-2S domain-containing protein [Mariniphaga sp.]
MKRHEFLSTIGISATTVIFSPFLTRCGSIDTGVFPSVPPIGNPSVDFTLNLSEPANVALTTSGGSLIKNGIIVAKTSTGSFIAVASVCTHQSAVIQYNNTDMSFFCSNQGSGHGSKFTWTGAVSAGPAGKLKMYRTELSGTSLRISGY